MTGGSRGFRNGAGDHYVRDSSSFRGISHVIGCFDCARCGWRWSVGIFARRTSRGLFPIRIWFKTFRALRALSPTVGSIWILVLVPLVPFAGPSALLRLLPPQLLVDTR